jgi:hypothetical protein
LKDIGSANQRDSKRKGVVWTQIWS